MNVGDSGSGGGPFCVELPNPVLIIFVGLQGSGKSSLAYRHFAPVEILSMDEFRARMCNDPASQSNSSPARAQLLTTLRKRLLNRVTTVIDSTNLLAEQRAELRVIAKECHVPTIAMVFLVSAEQCRERIDLRAGVIRADLLELNAALMGRTLRGVDNEGHSAVYRFSNQQADSIRFVHAPPDDADPERWFEVEQLRLNAWIFRHPADELRRHPSILAEVRPTWFFYARVAADLALAAREAPEDAGTYPREGAELRVRLPHCLPIDLVGGRDGWVRTPPHAG